MRSIPLLAIALLPGLFCASVADAHRSQPIAPVETLRGRPASTHPLTCDKTGLAVVTNKLEVSK